MIVGQIGTGRGVDDFLVEYPHLEREDILQALLYAARRTKEREAALLKERGCGHIVLVLKFDFTYNF